MIPACEDGGCPLPQVPGCSPWAWEGKGHHAGMSLGRETEQMQEAGRKFTVQGVLEQGGRKRMKREIGGISFDTQAGTVSGCAWEEQSVRK